ncbi:MAG: Plug domain-containing protein, partial [Longimicrobiales bacterium]|nr:Plug domain-containing protein [Longimicrobiales bacterium]
MREISNSNKHLNASFTLFLLITFVNVGFHDATLTAQQLPDSVISIDSLTVTVLRGSDAINQTPYAISIRDQIDLQRGNTGLSLEEALQGIPGVQVQNRYNYAVGERISIRGFGARAGFGVRGVKVIVDGIPATMADGQSTLDHVDIGS